MTFPESSDFSLNTAGRLLRQEPGAAVCNRRPENDCDMHHASGTAVAKNTATGGLVMFMFDRRQLFVGATLIVLIEIVAAAMRAVGR